MVFVSLFSLSAAMAQTVSGVITDSKTGDPIIGANILVKGTTTGTISDLDGSYSLSASEGQTLVISYIGYSNKEVVVGASSTIDIALDEGEVLDEVVVVGYGTVKKKDATGAVASIGTRDFQKGIVVSAEQLMQGRAAGVQIAQNSGEPGGGINVRIRGTSSVFGANQPLFVIDGFPISADQTSAGNDASGVGRQPAKNPLNFLNPNDIETIDILKDASATAIYGARGANGVVLISTKKGKGRPVVNYNYSLGVSNITKKYDLLSPNEYVAAGGQNTGSATDWQDELFRTGLTNEHAIAFGGGDNSSNYRFSLGYFNQNGIILNSALQRYSGTFNGATTFLDDRIKISSFLTLSNVKDKNVPISENVGFTGDLMGNILKFNPTNPIYDVNDTDGDDDKNEFYQPGTTEVNPLAFVNLSKDRTNTLRALANAQVEITLTDDLKFKTLIGTDRSLSNRSAAYSKDLITEANAGLGRAYFRDINIENNILESYLTYDKELNSINLSALVGYSYQSFDNKQKSSSAAKFRTSDLDQMINNVSAAEILVLNNSSNAFDEIQSLFGRVNLGINDKYLLTATLRADGSTKFGGDNKYGYFPSFAAKWKLINEDFINKGVFSDLGLRIGYGVTGNQNIGHNLYEFRTRYNDYSINTDATDITGGGVAFVAFEYPKLKWESTTQLNLGLDFAFMKGALRGSLDIYDKHTGDLLFIIPSPQPAPNPFANVNLSTDIQNRGVEMSLAYDIATTQKFYWDVQINGAYNKNLVKNLKGLYDTGEINGQGLTGAFAQRIAEGQPLFAFFLREFAGYDAEGNSIYPNGDVQQFLDGKSPLPTFTTGLTNNFRFGNLDASIFINGVFGNYIYSNTENAFFTKGSFANGRNVSKDVVNSSEGPLNAPDVSTRFLYKGDFVRLQNLNIGYQVPLKSNKNVTGLRLFLSGQNLLTFTKYPGQDPEVSTNKSLNGIPSFGIDYTAYPRARTITIGGNITF